MGPRQKTHFWTERFRIPRNILGGKYQIKASLEFKKNQGDKVELNNHKSSDYLFVYSEPDLAIVTFRHKLKKILRESTEFMAQLSWENQGGSAAAQNELEIRMEDVENPAKGRVLSKKALPDAPAISDTMVVSQPVTIPKITDESKYQLIAEIKTLGDLKEQILGNNIAVSDGLIGKTVAPIRLTGINLNTQISYPGKKVDLELKLKNTQPKADIHQAKVRIDLVKDGARCCSVEKVAGNGRCCQ